MSPTIRIHQERRGVEVTIWIRGAFVTGRRADGLLARVDRALDRGARTINLDMRDVPVIDCGGIGLLLLCREAAGQRGATLRVLHARGIVRTMLRLAAVLSPLQAEPSERDHVGRRPAQDFPLLLSA